MTAAEYVAGLPDRRPEEALRTFLACGGPMAAFELRRDGAHKALGVKLIPYHVTPFLIGEPLTVDTTGSEISEAHAVLARKRNLSQYRWDTPLFRELCAEMGLDPDQGRPRYRPPYAELAGELERWIGDALAIDAERGDSPFEETKAAVFDLLNLMRADRARDPALFDRLRRRWVQVDPGRMPRFSELERLLNSEELLDGEWAAGMALAGVEFLPSRYGAGYCASIYGFYGKHEPDGWVPSDYAGLRGIALLPDDDELRLQS